jgi:hypothetical protein
MIAATHGIAALAADRYIKKLNGLPVTGTLFFDSVGDVSIP